MSPYEAFHGFSLEHWDWEPPVRFHLRHASKFLAQIRKVLVRGNLGLSCWRPGIYLSGLRASQEWAPNITMFDIPARQWCWWWTKKNTPHHPSNTEMRQLQQQWVFLLAGEAGSSTEPLQVLFCFPQVWVISFVFEEAGVAGPCWTWRKMEFHKCIHDIRWYKKTSARQPVEESLPQSPFAFKNCHNNSALWTWDFPEWSKNDHHSFVP